MFDLVCLSFEGAVFEFVGEFVGIVCFVIVCRLGEGGMGVVYEVLDRDIDMCVVLKTIVRCSLSSLCCFKNEFCVL